MHDNISPKNLKQILQVCRAFGVSEIEFQGIKVTFGEPVSKPKSSKPRTYRTKASEAMIKEVESEGLEQASMELDEEDIALGHIEDPLGFENKLIRKELVDAEETANH